MRTGLDWGGLVSLLRPKHWIKNLFILAPLIFSLNLFNPAYLARSAICVLAFSLAASFTYVVNDMTDRERDREHPRKKKRPLASGKISLRAAWVLGALCLISASLLSITLNIRVLLIVAAYMLLNTLYSFVLKNIVIIDVLSIAMGFILRIFAGSYSIDVMLSNWILLSTLFISLFMGFGKRRHEMHLARGRRHRAVLQEYSRQLLDYMIVISVTLTIVTYSIYVADPETARKLGTDKLVYTIPFVLYGIFKYLYLIYRKDQGGDPAEVVLKDRGIALTVMLWAISVILLLYFGNAKLL